MVCGMKTLLRLATGGLVCILASTLVGRDLFARQDRAPATRATLKIYVNTDLEGISGVFKFAQTREKDTPLNVQACEYFMGDLAAVVRGLRDGGATEIVVLDGHGSQAVLPHLMAPGAKYITGTPRPGAGNSPGSTRPSPGW